MIDDDMEKIKAEEARLIAEENLMEMGYNSKPGGCGGDIVKSHNKKAWLENLSKSLAGKKNPRYNRVSNEELFELALKVYAVDGRIPTPPRLRSYGEEVGVKVPQSFTKFRDWKGIVARLELETNTKYDPYWHQRNRGKKNGQD